MFVFGGGLLFNDRRVLVAAVSTRALVSYWDDFVFGCYYYLIRVLFLVVPFSSIAA